MVVGCPNRSRSGSRVIATSGEGSDAGTATGLEDRVIADARRAARMILEMIDSPDRRLAARAAVYATRLDLRRDAGKTALALAWGAGTEPDPLFRALCWRFLAAPGSEGALPLWSPDRSPEPVVQVMAALAHARRGPVPEPLASALGLPTGKPVGPNRGALAKQLVERLLALAAPFDTGALALAVAFVEARRSEWVEPDRTGKTGWAARRLRSELARLVLGDDRKAVARVEQSGGSETWGPTALFERLMTPLVFRPIDLLRRAALAGSDDLRTDALRAIAVVSAKPVAGDLGAAAEALDAANPALRLEAARTFLLLTQRARQ